MTDFKFMGIDLHSNRFNICIIFPDKRRLKLSFQLTRSDMSCFIEKYLDKMTYVIIEASTNTFKFAALIKDYAKDVLIANTHKLKLISLVKKKTDKIDAEKLAIFLKMHILSNEELIKPVFIPKQIIQDLRSLFTTYKLTLKQKGQVMFIG